MVIQKLKLQNFKRFKSLVITFNEEVNIFIGDNESGKSSLLQALDIVMRGSRHLVEEIGLDRLINKDVVETFMASSSRQPDSLPKMSIELFLKETGNPSLNGRNNSEGIDCDGIRCICEPNADFSEAISHIITSEDSAFPFEYYGIEFNTFSGASYNGHNRPMRSAFVDNSMIGSDFAMYQYIQDIFKAKLSEEERTMARHDYRSAKCEFRDQSLSKFDDRLSGYSFSVRESSKDNLDTDLTIIENGIDISNKGTGKQCFIKTALALKQADDKLDNVLIEEPETHLSHLHMGKMIQVIQEAKNKQLFIATHSNLICTRLDLRNCTILNSRSTSFVQLKDLPDDTASFFMKAPDNNLLQFILSDKSILVEGDAEFMLMDLFCNKTIGKNLKDARIDVIAVDGKCFKRYLAVAKELRIRTAVITDNDKNYDKNIRDFYSGYIDVEYNNIKVFSDSSEDRYTFEVCLYKDNTDICNSLFGESLRSRTVEDYMIANKAECAFQLASNNPDGLIVPSYIQEAIRWIETGE